MQIRKRRADLLNYIIFLRVTPLLPNTFINVCSPIVNVPLPHFALGAPKLDKKDGKALWVGWGLMRSAACAALQVCGAGVAAGQVTAPASRRKGMHSAPRSSSYVQRSPVAGHRLDARAARCAQARSSAACPTTCWRCTRAASWASSAPSGSCTAQCAPGCPPGCGAVV